MPWSFAPRHVPSVSTARKGARAERKAKKYLEAQGYDVMRAAGSKGPHYIDLIAFNEEGHRHISLKYGGSPSFPKQETETLAAYTPPPHTSVEAWYWKKYARDPNVKVIQEAGPCE